jgi:hypothetical protein
VHEAGGTSSPNIFSTSECFFWATNKKQKYFLNNNFGDVKIEKMKSVTWLITLVVGGRGQK